MIAAKYQGEYEPEDAALMVMHDHNEACMRDAVASAGLDMGLLDRDLGAHDKAIDGLIKLNRLRPKLSNSKEAHLPGSPLHCYGLARLRWLWRGGREISGAEGEEIAGCRRPMRARACADNLPAVECRRKPA